MNKQIDWAALPADMVQGFQDFHSENPHVYTRLVSMVRQAKLKGRTRIGMKMLFEVLRWNHLMQTDGEPFKLNNNYTAFYTRLIESEYPALRGIITKRGSVADKDQWSLEGESK